MCKTKYHSPHKEVNVKTHLAPRVDDEGMAIRAAFLVVLSALRGRNDVALCLDGTRAQQYLPMSLPCYTRTCAGLLST